MHEVTTENVYRQHLVEVEGQTDILTMGIPYICPYNVNSIMNPILVMCMGLGYLFNLYRGKPLVREGGVVIMTHPTHPDFHPVHHPSYIDFYEQVLAETTDPHVMCKQVRGALRQRRVVPPPLPHELRLPRRAPVLHVVLGRARDAALRPGHHRRRRPAGRAPARVHARLARSTTRSRSPATSSAAPRRSPTSTPRRSWWPTSNERGTLMATKPGIAAPLQSSAPPGAPCAPSAERSVRRCAPALHRTGHDRRAQRRVPVPEADRAARRRGARGAVQARRRLRHRVGPLARRPRRRAA